MKNRSFGRRHRYWLLPVSYIVGSILLAFLMNYLDESRKWDSIRWGWFSTYLFTSAAIAKEVLSAIATSLLTMTTITFSVMMVVLSTYASQYSPRVLPNFTQSLAMQHAQGVFFAGFVYSITSLLLLKRATDEQLVPDAAVAVILATLCLVFFIYFIHKVSLSIQVNHLMNEVEQHALALIDDLQWTAVAPSPVKETSVNSARAGYVRTISYKNLIRFAQKKGLYIRLVPRIGQYVQKGEPLIEIWGKSNLGDSAASKYLDRQIRIGPTRTNEQDLEYVMEKIIDIALRAISPGINDPDTAVYCIRSLSVLLTGIAKREGDHWVIEDSRREGRVWIPFVSFDELLYKTFYQIRHYGAKDVSVTGALLDGLTRIAKGAQPEIKSHIYKFGEYVISSVNQQTTHALDSSFLNGKWQQLVKGCQS
ncbi:DUF2254 domain-containing protein [Paenibacillus chartarius]|uniref:DUF2254 domain-containing protein n=1 Tax=Paenibacillus chartarius TaxID=747481 RepID=A0ABV6DRY1_9BACL